MARRGRKKKTIEPDFVNIDDNTCSICEAEFLDIEDLRVHLTQTHPPALSDALCQCKFCPSSSTDVESYLCHILNEHIEELKVCEFCLRCFVEDTEFESHVAKHICDTSGRYQCSQCSVYYHSLKELQAHESSHTSGDGEVLHGNFPLLTSIVCMDAQSFLTNIHSGALICLKCDFKTLVVKKYLAHLKDMKCKIVVCEKCHQGFGNKIGLVLHVKVCADVLKREVECKKCGKMVRKIALKYHHRVCVEHFCQICNVKFDSIMEYSSHQLTHNPATTMMLRHCRYCGLEIIGEKPYVRHLIRTHKDYRLYKYKCITCNKIFRHPKHLFTHYNSRHHRDLKPYACNMCDESFRNRKQFTIHIKLKHGSVGFVEFDEHFLVYFVKERSEKPFHPPINPELFTKQEREDLANFIQQYDNLEKLNIKRLDKKRAALRRVCSISSEDQPLSSIKKKKRKPWPSNARLTCTICKRGFHKQQPYYKHLSEHFMSKLNKCFKCGFVFDTAQSLAQHRAGCAAGGVASKLRQLLEKRKSGRLVPPLAASVKFRATVRKVHIPADHTAATIVAAEQKQSAKDFLENFTAEGESKSMVVIKRLDAPVATKPTIKMRQFTQVDYGSHPARLKKPVRFKDDLPIRVRTIVKIHQGVSRPPPKLAFNSSPTQDVKEDIPLPGDFHFDAPAIPEVAEEVMLEHTEVAREVPAVVAESYPDMLEVAHLHDKAPFYKIVPVHPKKVERDHDVVRDMRLPSGTKLVTTNPLAHLMGGRTLEDLTKRKRKSNYKPRLNPTEALQKALMNFTAVPQGYKKVKKAKKVDAVDKED